MKYPILFLFFVCLLSAEETITTHTIQLQNGALSYTAAVGTMPTKDSEGIVKGEIGYIAYTKQDPTSNRPITFAFNGGPGSSSVWLHLGAFGPKRIVAPEEGQSIAPPYKLIDNLETILDLTDLVFIDPVGTGFAQTHKKEDVHHFYGVAEDIRSIADFIRDYVTLNHRWNSPKYLAGESYGTLRACGLASFLQENRSLYLNGIILISCAIDYQTLIFSKDNQLPYFLSLPTYAATAWYHGKYRPDAKLEEVINEARKFAYESYAPSLFNQRSMSGSEKEDLYLRLSELTALPFPLIRKYQGRIDDRLFSLEFFGEEHKVVGNYDTRILGDYSNPFMTGFTQDPSATTISGIFAGAFQNYLDSELNHPSNYCILSLDANSRWNYLGNAPWGYPNLMDSLRSALVVNPTLKLFVACGYFDAVTPFTAAEYCFDHLDLPASYDSNIQIEYYEGGHMYYLNPSARIKFKQDLVRYFQK